MNHILYDHVNNSSTIHPFQPIITPPVTDGVLHALIMNVNNSWTDVCTKICSNKANRLITRRTRDPKMNLLYRPKTVTVLHNVGEFMSL